MMYFVKIAIAVTRYDNCTQNMLIILMVIGIPSPLKQLLFLCSKGRTYIVLSQWAGVIICLPSQLCQISIDSDQVSGKLKHD
jgi:hypothetical protein